MTSFINMLIAALYAMLFQNLVFTAAYGVSESIKIAKRPKHFVMCAFSVGFYSVTVSLVCRALEQISVISNLPIAFHYVLYILVLAVIYLVSGYLCVHALKADKKFMNSLGMCAFNSLVLSVPVLDFKANYTVLQSVATGVGATLAFVLAVLLINAGIRHIEKSKNIPTVFKGTPVLLIYISLLCLALSCFSGQSLFI
ncbi:MAG: Rnf-Nqr domain containing protein [Acutalibacteraceae bacterium]